jgi:hypothetical protein
MEKAAPETRRRGCNAGIGSDAKRLSNGVVSREMSDIRVLNLHRVADVSSGSTSAVSPQTVSTPKSFSVFGQRNLPGGGRAFEQCHAEDGFELSDLPADGGLCAVDSLSRARKGTRFHHGYETPKQINVQHRLLIQNWPHRAADGDQERPIMTCCRNPGRAAISANQRSKRNVFRPRSIFSSNHR